MSSSRRRSHAKADRDSRDAERPRHLKRRHHDPDDDSCDSDQDLGKELHPISYFINDREEMVNQIFSVIRGAKLRAMLTSSLRGIDLNELKELCLIQLEGMSKKRIKCVLAGKQMDESSDTEDDEDKPDTDDNLDDLFHGTTSTGEKSYASKGVTAGDRCHAQEALVEDTLYSDDVDDVKFPKAIKKSTDRPKKPMMSVKLKDKKKSAGKPNDASLKAGGTDASRETSGSGESSKSKMELLELEMRARAIKALLNKEEARDEGLKTESDEFQNQVDDGQIEEVEEELKQQDKEEKGQESRETFQNQVSDEQTEEAEVGLNERDKEERRRGSKEMKALAEREQALAMARETLMRSEERQRADDERREKIHAEIRTKLEEQQKLQEAEETWADRWFQNKKVQKVMKDSKIMSKVRTQIKIKDIQARPAVAGEKIASSGASSFEELPNIIGSLDEYDKIVKSKPSDKEADTTDADKEKDSDSDNKNEDDDEDEEDNELWGAIMGKSQS